jgi:hypothetical protein
MQLKEIMDGCKHLHVVEQRCSTVEFIDLVFNNADIEEWQRVLSRFLGAPRKPKGQAPSDSDLQITAKTGGIRTDQTLFEKDFPVSTIIAKFWPWKDNQHTTLRMAMLLKV